MKSITGVQLRAARSLVRWRAEDLANASKVGVATIRRAEALDGPVAMTEPNAAAIRRVLEERGVEFTNGDQPGVRLRSELARGVIYNDKGPVATVKDGEVFDNNGRKIAAVGTFGDLVSLNSGERVGSLALLGVKGEMLPEAFNKILPG